MHSRGVKASALNFENKMIVIIEGPPGSNTSKVAHVVNNLLSLDNDTSTIQHIDHPELDDNTRAKLYFSSLSSALTYNKHVVLDGAWHFTDLPNNYKRMLDRSALSRSGIVIKCLPSMDECIENSTHGSEQVRESYRKFITEADEFNDMPSMYLDYENGHEKLFSFVKEHNFLNTYQGGGRFKEGNILVLCSKWRVSKEVKKSAVVIPYINFNEIPGATRPASALITEAFENGGIPEQDIYWINVESTYGVPLDAKIIEHMKPRRVIAIGSQPRLWAMANNVQAEFLSQPNRSDTMLSLF